MMETNANTGTTDAANAHTGRCILLTDATQQFDPSRLSPTLTLIRSCLEIYETTPADIASRAGVGGRAVRLGQVGIRCRYCRTLPQTDRARGSVVHPTSLKLVYQAIRNWQRHHFAKCPLIPEHVRRGAEAGKGKRSQRGGEGGAAVDMTTFWMNGCVELGLVDAEDGCIRFREGAPMHVSGGTNIMNDRHSSGSGSGDLLFDLSGAMGQQLQYSSGASTHSGTVSNTSLAAMSHGSAAAAASTSVGGSGGGKDSFVTRESGSGSEYGDHYLSFKATAATASASGGTANATTSSGLPPVNELFNLPAPDIAIAPANVSSNNVIGAPNLDPMLLQRQLEQTQQQIRLTQHRLEQTRQQMQQQGQHSGSRSPPTAAGHIRPPAASSALASLPLGHDISGDAPIGGGRPTQPSRSQAPSTPSAAHPQGGAAVGIQDLSEVLDLLQRASQLTDVYRKRAEDEVYNGISLPVCTGEATLPSHHPSSGGDDGSSSALEEKRNNLKNLLVQLGREMYVIFSGEDPFQGVGEGRNGDIDANGAASHELHDDADDMSRPAKKNNGAGASMTSPEYIPLRHLFFPVSVCTLVSALLDLREADISQLPDKCCYRSLEDVDEDLQLMLDSPEKYLTDADPSPRVLITDDPNRKLYGRDAQTSELLAALGRSFSTVGQPEMVFIRGYPGVGKSVLVQQMLPPLRDELGGGMASAAFSQGTQPISVIFSAFDSYFRQLWVTGDQRLEDTRDRIQSALGDKSDVLDELIPSLPLLLGPPRSSLPMSIDSIEGSQALQRIVHCLRILIKCIAGPAHPLILFLDDLQWADRDTLDLLSQIMSIPDLTSFMFVGTYRENEVDDSHPIALEIARYKSEGLSVTTIEVGNLDRASINSLCSDSFHLLPRVTKPLVDVVYRKTQGNSLFTLSLMKAIQEENMLFYSANARRWLWNIDAIRSRDIDNDVVSLLTRKMLKLDQNMQWLLRTASCFGTEFDMTLLELLSSDTKTIDIKALANMAVDEGFLHRELSSLDYRFVHDQVREAAYSIIPESEREHFHLSIGRQLMQKMPPQKVEDNIFAILGQMFKGISLVEDHSEKLSIAKFCLVGGEKATSTASFPFAAKYLAQGCQLLCDKDWGMDYELALQLHTGAANALLVIGDYERMLCIVEKVLAQARVFLDKLPAYYAMIYGAGTQGKVNEVIRHAMGILDEMGVNLSAKPEMKDVRKCYEELQPKLEIETDNADFARKLLSRKAKDPHKIAAMRVLTMLSRYAFISNQLLGMMSTLTGVAICLDSGTTKDSALFFAMLGATACILDDYDEGYKFGKVSLAMLRESNDKTMLPRVYMILHGLVFIFVDPLQAGLEQLKYGYEIGLSVGDTESAFTNIWLYVVSALTCGRPLGSLSEEITSYLIGMKAYKNHMQHLLLPYGQSILNLIGIVASNSNDEAKNDQSLPYVLKGALLDENNILNRPLTPRSVKVVETIHNLKAVIAYLFRQYDVAAVCTEKAQGVTSRPSFSPSTQVFNSFYRGLIAIQMCRTEPTQAERWRGIFEAEAAKMKRWSDTASWNCEHKYLLFLAEASYLDGDRDAAKISYEDSIRLASEHGFVCDQALACERMGLFHAETAGTDAALPYFQRALCLYQEFGAEAKVKHLLMSIGSVGFLG